MTIDRLEHLDERGLDELRTVGDPDADQLAVRLLEENPGLDERDLVRMVLDHIDPTTETSHDFVGHWVLEGPRLPDWTDLSLVRAGQQLFGQWPLPMATALFCVSLPSAYAAAQGSHVLTMTSDLATRNLARRTVETGQMLFDVMDFGRGSPEVLHPGGQGYLTIRGVRLLHATVRRTLLATNHAGLNPEAASLTWSADWGYPINQEDLLGTLLTFTVGVFHGLDQLGIPYEPAAADAYLHTWCVIGYLLGIQPGLLPLDRLAAERLALTIARRHHGRSEAGVRLTAALLSYMELSMPLGLRKLPRTLMQHMLPPPIPDLIDVPPAAWWHPALGVVARLGPHLARIPGGVHFVQAPTALFGRAMLRMVVERGLNGRQPAFRLDPVVVEQLALRTSPTRYALRSRRRRIRATS